ncbi:hypothetical protein ACU8OH_36325 (plasmid) [Rhizobium leguminosarum]
MLDKASQTISNGVKLALDTGNALKIIEEQIVLINTQRDAVTASSCSSRRVFWSGSSFNAKLRAAIG